MKLWRTFEQTLAEAEASESWGWSLLGGLLEDHAKRGHWRELLELRNRLRQDCPTHWHGMAADHIGLRVAHSAPAVWVACLALDDDGRYRLWEVAASTHTWAELAPHLPDGRTRLLVAYERALRGEDLSDAGLDTSVYGLPFALQPWEPEYGLTVYLPSEVPGEYPQQPTPSSKLVTLPSSVETIEDASAREAVLTLVEGYCEQRFAAVRGSALAAIAGLGRLEAMIIERTGTETLGLMADAAAGGPANGAGPGSVMGRVRAWRAVAALAGQLHRWPLASEEVGATLERLDWLEFDLDEDDFLQLNVAVHDERRGRSYALAAWDTD